MKRLLLFIILLASYGMIFSQVSTYTFSQGTSTYSEITGGTAYASTATTTIDAEVYTNLPIGFTFNFNGTDYTAFGISADGWISMGSTSPTSSTLPLSSGSTNNVISAGARDLYGRQFVTASTTSGSPTVVMTAGSLLGASVSDPMGGTGIGTGALVSSISSPNVTASVNCTSTGTGRNIRFFNGVIRYETLGTAPNRKLVVQWKKFSRYTTSAPSDYFNFQIVLNETTNTINIIYDFPYVYTTGTHQVGLRGASSSDFNNRSTTTDWSSTTAGSSNSSTCSVSNTIFPASGLTFSWTPSPPCSGTPSPGNTISSSNPVCPATSFNLSLQNSTSGTGVTYQWQSSPDNSTWTNISGATSSTYTATQTVATWYRCNVTCSGNTGTSTPLQVTINTSAPPYSESFTTTSTPTCWTITGWTIGSTRGVTGNPANNIYKNLYSGATSGNFSMIDIGPITAGMALSFEYKVSNYSSPYDPPAAGSGNFVVAVSTNGGSSYTDLTTVTNNAVAGYQSKSVDLSAYAGQTIKIKITGNWVSGDWDMGFDNIKVEVPPSCTSPSNLSASSITNNSANIGWTAGGSETAWEYVYGISPVASPSGSGTATTNNPTSLSGLSGNTTYQFYVRANCGGDFSPWAGPYTFKTLCDPISSINEYFDGVTAPALPDCWSKYTSPSWSSQTVTTITTTPYTAPNVVQIYSSGATSSSDAPILISPKLTNLSSGTYQLRFFAKGASTNLSVIVGTMSNPANAASFTPFTTVTGLTTSGYVEKIVSFASYSGSDTYIAFKHPLTTTYSYIYIDDVHWEPIPLCPQPTSLTATSITPSSANIGWTAGGSETAWEYVYGVSPLAAPGGAGTATTSNPVAVSGLTSNTTYQFYVRANCGGDYSAWSGPASFYTGYCQPTGGTAYYLTNVITSGGVTNISNASGASSGGYGNYSATISCSNYIGTSTSISLSSSESDDYYYCWIDWNNDLDFGDANETIFATTSYTAGYTGTINIPSGTAVGNYRMRVANSWSGAISSCGPAPNGEYEDYTFTVTNPPACPAPGSLTATSITSTTANIGWTASGTETAWEYVYGVSPVSSPSGSGTPTTNNPTSLSGLTASTTYQFYVRADCGNGSYSTWAGPYTFSTLPANDECAGAINVTVNGDNTCTLVTSGTTLGATQSQTGCSGTADDDVWFKFRASYSTHLIDILNVVAVSGSSTDMMHQVFSGTCGNLTSLVCSDPNSSTVSGLTVGQTYYIRVYTYYSTSRTTFDLCVKMPACSTPTGLSATNPTTNGATLNWTENGGASNWDLYIVAAGSPAPDGSTTPTVDNTTTKPYVWTGGAPSTPYDWYVRADCAASGSSGQSAWSAVGTFTTSSAEAVDWCNLQWPPNGAIEVGGTFDIYAQTWEPGVTDQAGQGAGITAWIGYSTSNTDPNTWTNWVAATYNVDAGNNDEYKATLSGLAVGTYYYASRFKLNAGPYKYGGYSAGGGGFWDGTSYVSGVLTINPKAGDMLCNSIALTVDAAPATYSNTNCTGETGEPNGTCWGSTTSMESIWFSFVAPSTGSVRVSTDFVTPLTDTHIALYSVGDCNNMASLTQLGCDEDGGSTGSGWNSIMTVNGLTSGTTYYVQVDGYGTADGQFQIEITKQCPATMTVLPASSTAISSTSSCVDGSGWTHYLDNSNNLLLSLKLGTSGAVISGVTVDPDGATDAVYVLNDPDGFPQVGGSSGAAFLRRKWNANATTQPSSDVPVRFYYTVEEYNAVNTQITSNGGVALTSHNQLNFYKVLNGMDPFNIGPGGLAIGNIALITNGATAGINTWVAGTATGGYYAEYLVAGFSGGGGGGASSGKLLPLDLVSFTGYADKDANVLNWTTVNEVNTDKFIVERSIDGNKWEYVADVNASGNSKSDRSYTASDEKPYSLSYYRLKMMDRDGRYSYSKNISIERKDNTFRLYSVSPNPNNGNFAVTFNSKASGKTNLVVVNALGMKVYAKSVDSKTGTNNEFLGIDNLTDGIYTLILEQDGQILTQRIAINK